MALSISGHNQRVLEKDLDVEIALVDERANDARQNEVVPSLKQPRKLRAGSRHVFKMHGNPWVQPAKSLDDGGKDSGGN